MNDSPNPGKRRIDRILAEGYVSGLEGLSLDEVRARRDECLAEREYLSFLRRQVQGRLDILRAEQQRRTNRDETSLVDQLASVLADEGGSGPSRGEALRIHVPEEEMLLARRRIEALVADAALSDPRAMSDQDLDRVIGRLEDEEREVSGKRSEVLSRLDLLQDDLKRRYKEDPAQALTT